jgi:hypothetical protein
METVVDEIGRAAQILGLGPEQFRHLAPPEEETVYFSALKHFVASDNRRWWWEAFRETGTSRQFIDGDGWKHIPGILPNPNEVVWFIAEESQSPNYPVFETTPRLASQIIGECYGFEYYLIAKDFSWLLCENHHDYLIAVGAAVERRLVTYGA